MPMHRVLLNMEGALKSGQVVLEFETFECQLFTSPADSTNYKTVDRGYINDFAWSCRAPIQEENLGWTKDIGLDSLHLNRNEKDGNIQNGI